MACDGGRQGLSSSLSNVACLVGGTEDGMRGKEKRLLTAFLLHRVSKGKRKQNVTLDVAPW